MRPLTTPRRLGSLGRDQSGQLVTEWVLLTAAIVIPLILLVPNMLELLSIYFNRIAEVIALPFP